MATTSTTPMIKTNIFSVSILDTGTTDHVNLRHVPEYKAQ